MTQGKNVFEQLPRVEDDSLLALIGLFNADPRSEKVDLGVGVYRDEEGRTPVMRAVKAAEARLQATEETKTYIGPRGDKVFLDHLWDLAMGDKAGLRFAGVQTPGGSGALRLARTCSRNCRRSASGWGRRHGRTIRPSSGRPASRSRPIPSSTSSVSRCNSMR